MPNGFHNKILHVELSDRTWRIEEPGEAWFRKYGGGRGLIAANLLKYVPADADLHLAKEVLCMLGLRPDEAIEIAKRPLPEAVLKTQSA